MMKHLLHVLAILQVLSNTLPADKIWNILCLDIMQCSWDWDDVHVSALSYTVINKKSLNNLLLLNYDITVYVRHVTDWFKQLLPRMRPLLYVNGGPIISVQVFIDFHTNENDSNVSMPYDSLFYPSDSAAHYWISSAKLAWTPPPLQGRIYVASEYPTFTRTISIVNQSLLHQVFLAKRQICLFWWKKSRF